MGNSKLYVYAEYDKQYLLKNETFSFMWYGGEKSIFIAPAQGYYDIHIWSDKTIEAFPVMTDPGAYFDHQTQTFTYFVDEMSPDEPKCSCGTTKTYGDSMHASNHSSWCDVYKKWEAGNKK